MSRKKELLYWKEAVREDGTVVRFAIRNRGRSWWIDDHLVHPSSGSDVDKEIRIVFHAKVTGTVLPGGIRV